MHTDSGIGWSAGYDNRYINQNLYTIDRNHKSIWSIITFIPLCRIKAISFNILSLVTRCSDKQSIAITALKSEYIGFGDQKSQEMLNVHSQRSLQYKLNQSYKKFNNARLHMKLLRIKMWVRSLQLEATCKLKPNSC